MAKWYYSVGDRAQGPVDEAVILENIQNGTLTVVDLVYREGDQAWITVGEVPEFKAAFSEPSVSDLEISEPPPVATGGPFKFSVGIQLTWVLLQKVREGDRDRYEQSGPYSAEQLEALLLSNSAKYSDYVWRPGYKRWTRLGNLPEFDRRRKNRDGDQTPDLVPLPDVELSIPEESRELLQSVVQAAPASLVPPAADEVPEEASGNDLAEVTASQYDARLNQNSSLPQFPPLADTRKQADDTTPVPKVPQVEIPSRPGKEGGTDPEATFVQSASATRPVSEDSERTIVHPENGEGIELEEMPARNWQKPAMIASGAIALGAIGFVLVQKFAPGLIASPQGDSEPQEIVEVVEPQKAPPPPQPVQVAAQPPPVAQPQRIERPYAEPELPAQAVAQVQPEVKQESVNLPVRAVQAGAKASVVEVVAIRTEIGKPQIAVNTDAPVGSTIWLTVSARSGEILKFPSYYRSTSLMRGLGQVPVFDLSSWRLPAGQYRVEAAAGDVRTSKMVFIGRKDNAFSADIERHLKYLSFQQQEEKKALFHSARNLEKLAKNLGDNYFRYRNDAGKWRGFYFDWQKQVKKVKQVTLDRVRIERRNEMTYPDEMFALKMASDRLIDQARTLHDSIMSNTPARDVAATGQLAIVREFTKLRSQVAQISSRR